MNAVLKQCHESKALEPCSAVCRGRLSAWRWALPNDVTAGASDGITTDGAPPANHSAGSGSSNDGNDGNDGDGDGGSRWDAGTGGGSSSLGGGADLGIGAAGWWGRKVQILRNKQQHDAVEQAHAAALAHLERVIHHGQQIRLHAQAGASVAAASAEACRVLTGGM